MKEPPANANIRAQRGCCAFLELPEISLPEEDVIRRSILDILTDEDEERFGSNSDEQYNNDPEAEYGEQIAPTPPVEATLERLMGQANGIKHSVRLASRLHKEERRI